MDLNLVVICGRLAMPVEIKTFESGTTVVRLLVTTRTESPQRRVDVVPVTYWNPSEDMVNQLSAAERGTRVWVCGALQRRFWVSSNGRRSQLSVVAEQVNLEEPELEEVGHGS